MVLVSGHYPSAVERPGGLPHPGPKPYPEAVPVVLTCAMQTTEPYAITGDAGQGLWLSPEEAEFVVRGKNGYVVPDRPRQ